MINQLSRQPAYHSNYQLKMPAYDLVAPELPPRGASADAQRSFRWRLRCAALRCPAARSEEKQLLFFREQEETNAAHYLASMSSEQLGSHGCAVMVDLLMVVTMIIYGCSDMGNDMQ